MKKTIFKKIAYTFVSLLLFGNLTLATGCNNSERAAMWLVNTSAPTASSKGNVGDMWLDTSTYDIYQLQNNGWILCGNIKAEDGTDGMNGVNGNQGQNGVDGAAWFTGTGIPTQAVKGKIGGRCKYAFGGK